MEDNKLDPTENKVDNNEESQIENNIFQFQLNEGVKEEKTESTSNEVKIEELHKEETKQVKQEEVNAAFSNNSNANNESKPKAKNLKWKLAIGFSTAGAVLAGGGIATGVCIGIYQKQLKSYTLTFDPGEGYFSEGQGKIVIDKVVPFAQVSKPEVFNSDPNKLFLGWFVKDEDLYPYNDQQTVTSNMTLKARFADMSTNNYWKVTFDPGKFKGATFIGNTTMAIPRSTYNYFGLLNRPLATALNYNFMHWSTNQENPAIDQVKYETLVTDNITLYPYFQYDIEEVLIQGSDNIYVTKQAQYTSKIIGSASEIKWSVTDKDGGTTDLATINESTGQLIANKAGVIKVIATPTLEPTKKAEKLVTINNPYVGTEYITCYGKVGSTETWWIINNDSLYNEGKIYLTKFNDSQITQEVDRSEFDLPIYIGQNVAGIKNYFLHDCTKFNSPIMFAENCKISSIGDYFLSGCEYFNNKLDLPSTLLHIGSYFMNKCVSFNNGDSTYSQDVPLIVPNQITSIEDGFLNSCGMFNQKINMSDNVTAIKSNFLHGCVIFNKKISLSENLKVIEDNFLDSCAYYNTMLTLPDSLIEIGDSFMYACSSFNKDLTIPVGIQKIGKAFMYDCEEMISAIDISTTRSVNEVFWNSERSETLAVHSNESTSYDVGLNITGTQADAFKNLFPVSHSKPFRKYK